MLAFSCSELVGDLIEISLYLLRLNEGVVQMQPNNTIKVWKTVLWSINS